jgi:hypothetical protein
MTCEGYQDRGYALAMTETPDDARVEQRAVLLPEEEAAGSDDREAILEDSDERTEDPEGTKDRSTQTPDIRQSGPPTG